jgi:hypothetical protein
VSRYLQSLAKEAILMAAVNAALSASEGQSREDLAVAIRIEGARLAKRWGYYDWPGLPATFEKIK